MRLFLQSLHCYRGAEPHVLCSLPHAAGLKLRESCRDEYQEMRREGIPWRREITPLGSCTGCALTETREQVTHEARSSRSSSQCPLYRSLVWALHASQLESALHTACVYNSSHYIMLSMLNGGQSQQLASHNVCCTFSV